MRLIFEPNVYVVGRQHIDEAELTRFLDDNASSGWTTDTEIGGEILSEVAGRLCYLSYARPRPGGNSAYLHHIKEVGHGSVLEHAVWNFIFTGVSRSLTHELVRHRAGVGFSQLSQRYVDESDCAFVVPPELRIHVETYLWEKDFVQTAGRNRDTLDPTTSAELVAAYTAEHEARWPGVPVETIRERSMIGWRWHECMAFSHLTYCNFAADLLRLSAPAPSGQGDQPRTETPTERRKAARQAARSVLPNATETKIFVTMNARAARHFLEMRGSRHADAEIRILAGKFHEVLLRESPNLFGDYVRTPLPDGTFELNTPHRKV